LLLVARPERKDVVVYPKLRITIDKKTLQMVRQEYFEADGRHVRTQIRGNMRTWRSPDYAVQSEVKMIDHTNRDHSTTLTFSEFEAMMEVPGRFFTKRTLVRGE